MTTLAISSAKTIVAIVVLVLGFTALMVVGLWLMARKYDRAQQDPAYLRRVFMRGGLRYGCSIVIGTALVVTGHLPKESLIGLPVVAFFCWMDFRMATRVKLPPGKEMS